MKKLILVFILALPFTIDTLAQCDVKLYLDLSDKHQVGHKLDPTTTQLDSLLFDNSDITSIDSNDFVFNLTKEAANRLESINLDFKVFTLVINNEPVLAGWFWGCYSSLGTIGYVIFNLNCGDEERDELRILYSLPTQAIPDRELIKKTCANKTYKL